MRTFQDVLIDDAPFCFVDCETTGLDPFHGDRVCEIAFLRVEKGITTRSFESLVNPQREISLGAFSINGIRPEMLEGKPLFIELVPEILESIKGAIVVGHNVHFDLNFLKEEFRRVGMNLDNIISLDTLKLARRKFVFPSFALAQLARGLGLELPQGSQREPLFRGRPSVSVAQDYRLHRAMTDVLVLRDVFERLVQELRQGEGLLHAGDLLKISGA